MCIECPEFENPECRTEETHPWVEPSLLPPGLQPLGPCELFFIFIFLKNFAWHAGSWFPNQGSNLHPCSGSAES